jgi:hypothetical protein
LGFHFLNRKIAPDISLHSATLLQNEEAGLHMMILFVAKTHGIYDEKVLYCDPESDL